MIESFERYRWSSAFAVFAAFCAGLLAVGVIGTTPCRAASVPAWLDAGISTWNEENPEVQIRFVDIKDSFVWYDIPRTPEIGNQRIREGVNQIVLRNGYTTMDDEEMITTAKPPVTEGRSAAKKCWSRSFVLNIQSQSNTKAVGGEAPGQRQRLLTSLVCEDTSNYWAAFRVAE